MKDRSTVNNVSVKEFVMPLRVYIEDTDAGGIVYYVNYLKYIERSRTELLRSLGYGKAAVLADNLLLVVRSAQVDYLAPALLDDELAATARLKKIANTYVIFHQQVRRGKQLLCDAEVKVACVRMTATGMRPAPLPEEIKHSLIDYLENQ